MSLLRKVHFCLRLNYNNEFYWLWRRVPDIHLEPSHHETFLWTLSSENKQTAANGSLKFIPI